MKEKKNGKKKDGQEIKDGKDTNKIETPSTVETRIKKDKSRDPNTREIPLPFRLEKGSQEKNSATFLCVSFAI